MNILQLHWFNEWEVQTFALVSAFLGFWVTTYFGVQEWYDATLEGGFSAKFPYYLTATGSTLVVLFMYLDYGFIGIIFLYAAGKFIAGSAGALLMVKICRAIPRDSSPSILSRIKHILIGYSALDLLISSYIFFSIYRYELPFLKYYIQVMQ